MSNTPERERDKVASNVILASPLFGTFDEAEQWGMKR